MSSSRDGKGNGGGGGNGNGDDADAAAAEDTMVAVVTGTDAWASEVKSAFLSTVHGHWHNQ